MTPYNKQMGEMGKELSGFVTWNRSSKPRKKNQ
jgi:hypothetical protein